MCTQVSAVCYRRFPRHRSWHMRRRWHCFAHPESAPMARACHESVWLPCAPPGESVRWCSVTRRAARVGCWASRAARLGRVHSQGRPHTAIRSHARYLACAGRVPFVRSGPPELVLAVCQWRARRRSEVTVVVARIFILLRLQPSPTEALFFDCMNAIQRSPILKARAPTRWMFRLAS